MPGTLYLCATPIGNLGDMTPRVVETLQTVDVIAAEDTRNSIKLLNHFDIHTPMTSYHEYNKVEKAHQLVGQLLNGQNIALITDAGTPAISDPGEVLVRMCQEQNVPVTSLPGPAACITALTLSGLSTRRFCFEGFLPADKKEKKAILEELKTESRTMILYEAPHHLIRTLEELYAALGGAADHVVQRTDQEVRDRISHHFGKGAGLLQDRGAPRRICPGSRREESGRETTGRDRIMGIYEH